MLQRVINGGLKSLAVYTSRRIQSYGAVFEHTDVFRTAHDGGLNELHFKSMSLYEIN